MARPLGPKEIDGLLMLPDKASTLLTEWCSGGNMGPRQLVSKEIDGLRMPPGKTYSILTDHLVNGSGLGLPRKSGQAIHTNEP